MTQERGRWKSRLGFILAASGSAIGLGNIVFFSANAYKYGGGAFYVPYFIAFFLVGLPIMVLEFSLGRFTGKSFPVALRQIGGWKAEAAGWFGIFNAGIITLYYCTILGWVLGCMVGSFGAIWKPSAVAAFNLPAGALSPSMAYFFTMLSRYDTCVYVAIVWLCTMLMVTWGTKSIEKAVSFCVPLMWLMMIVMIIRGLTLENGLQGVWLLFTPDFSIMMNPAIWKGAFSQMFFTLSLGFGIMTTYASYLPKDADDVTNAANVSFMNCGFEFISGLAIFSLLFTFSIIPKASTLSMMFFIVPEGIARFPFWIVFFGVMFYLLLFLAGITSAVSLVEAVIASIIDTVGWSRLKTVVVVGILGTLGSITFALPTVVDPGLSSNGTLGLSLLDLFDHWAFSYGLLISVLFECIFIGWVFDLDRLRAFVNQSAWFPLGKWYNWLIRFVIPAIIILILGAAVSDEIQQKLYGSTMVTGQFGGLYLTVFGFWLGGGIAIPAILVMMKRLRRATTL